MGTRYQVDRSDDAVKSAITVTGAITLPIAVIDPDFIEPAGAISITVGDLIHNSANRFEVDRAIQQMVDVLREAQWPDGALATDFAYLLTPPDVKGSVVIGNAAQFPDLLGDENMIFITYNSFAGTGQGSSSNYQSAFGVLRNFIREALTDG